MRVAAFVISCLAVLGACGATEDATNDEAATDGEATTDGEAATDGEATTDGGPQVDLTQPVAIAGGQVTTGQVTIGETTIDYVTVAPDGFVLRDSAPVLLAMPPGGQDLALTRSVVEGTFAEQAIARGWVVLSPAAPNGELYFQGSEALIPALLEWAETWVTIEGEQPHLAGISNGGISSFRLAALHPERFRSIVAFPGFPRSDEDRAALSELTDTPIRLFVGELDTGWVAPMTEATATLNDLGGDVTLDVREGEGHVMASLSDGVQIFDELDANR